MAKGYVYIPKNKYVPDLVKIGFTDRDPATRAKELSSTTGVPGKWAVYKSWLVEDAYSCEQRIFHALKGVRETGEFFRLAPDRAVEKVAVLLASWGETDASGLSAPARREVEIAQKKREVERAEREEKLRRRKEEDDQKKAEEALASMRRKIDQEIMQRRDIASKAIYEKWKLWFRLCHLQNTFTWGVGGFLALAFLGSSIRMTGIKLSCSPRLSP